MNVRLFAVIAPLMIELFCSAQLTCMAAKQGIVEGDRSLLDLLLAAQATGRASFPHGALDAEVHSDLPGQSVDATAHVVWDGASTYWNYKQAVKNRGADPEFREGEMIETRDLLTCYWPKYKLAQIIGNKQYGYRRELRMRPDQMWFATKGDGRSWSDLFDIGTAERPPKVDNFQKLTVHRDGDRIVVTRHYKVGVLRIVASLSAGGNVVEYAVTPTAEDPMWSKGNYEWIELPDKRWRLKHHAYVFSVRGTKDSEQHYELTISSFDPEPLIAPDRFRFDSLHIPARTKVERVSAAGTDSQRQGQVMPTRQQLDGLAEQLRKVGFAAPYEENR